MAQTERCWSCERFPDWTDDWVRMHPSFVHPTLPAWVAERPHPKSCRCAYHAVKLAKWTRDLQIASAAVFAWLTFVVGHWVFGWW